MEATPFTDSGPPVIRFPSEASPDLRRCSRPLAPRPLLRCTWMRAICSKERRFSLASGASRKCARSRLSASTRWRLAITISAFGVSQLYALRRAYARFPLVAANLAEEQHAGLVAPTAIVVRAGLRIAVIGLGRRPSGAPSLGDCAVAVQAAVNQVRSEADLVVLLSHLGRDADLALVPLITGVDLVIGGHTHDVLDPPALVLDCGNEVAQRVGCSPRSIPVVHPGAYGRYLGRADLVLSRDPQDLAGVATGRAGVVVDARFQLIPVNATIAEEATMSALIAPYASVLDAAGTNLPMAFAPEPVSRRAVLRGDSPLGDFVADAIRETASADLAFINTTGIRADVVAGPVTHGDLVTVLPFSDEVVTLQMTGDDLLRAVRSVVADACRQSEPCPFQVGGGRAAIDCAGGSLDLEVGGTPLDRTQSYRIAAVSFLTDGGGWLAGPSAKPTGETVEDAVEEVVREQAVCPKVGENTLPCLVATADGRIAWH